MQLEPYAIPIERGEGALLYDPEGREYIDAISSWWVNTHGHANPRIADAIAKQAQKLEQVIFAGFTHEPAVELAEKLLGILPANQERIFFSDDGSTSVEVALKLAIQYWHNRKENRRKIIAFEDAYHGDTFGAMSVTARDTFTLPFHDYLFEVSRIPVPVSGCEEQAKEALKGELQSGGVAALIIEPLILGAGGMIMYSPEVLETLVSLAHEYGALVIADEVMTGFGR
ncbi:MAG: aminotransferase class III-fold pyridoxal phosphate-dependent enzyme, partial [Candidatus Dadabacteria bacterium]